MPHLPFPVRRLQAGGPDDAALEAKVRVFSASSDEAACSEVAFKDEVGATSGSADSKGGGGGGGHTVEGNASVNASTAVNGEDQNFVATGLAAALEKHHCKWTRRDDNPYWFNNPQIRLSAATACEVHVSLQQCSQRAPSPSIALACFFRSLLSQLSQQTCCASVTSRCPLL